MDEEISPREAGFRELHAYDLRQLKREVLSAIAYQRSLLEDEDEPVAKTKLAQRMPPKPAPKTRIEQFEAETEAQRNGAL
jgi:hypothetical protein